MLLDDVLGLSAEEFLAYRDLVAMTSTGGLRVGGSGCPSPGRRGPGAARPRATGWWRVGRTTPAGTWPRHRPSPSGRSWPGGRTRSASPSSSSGRLDEVYRDASEGADRRSRSTSSVAPNAVRQRFEQVQLGARQEVLAFVKPPVARHQRPGQHRRGQGRRPRRAVPHRPGALDAGRRPDDDPAGHRRRARASEVRVADSVPLKLVVVDRRLAYLPLASDPGRGRRGAPGPRRAGCSTRLVALFEAVWERATPLVSSPDQVPEGIAKDLDEVDAQVLSLLLAGLTDQAVASHLDLSLRTVQRRGPQPHGPGRRGDPRAAGLAGGPPLGVRLRSGGEAPSAASVAAARAEAAAARPGAEGREPDAAGAHAELGHPTDRSGPAARSPGCVGRRSRSSPRARLAGRGRTGPRASRRARAPARRLPHVRRPSRAPPRRAGRPALHERGQPAVEVVDVVAEDRGRVGASDERRDQGVPARRIGDGPPRPRRRSMPAGRLATANQCRGPSRSGTNPKRRRGPTSHGGAEEVHRGHR